MQRKSNQYLSSIILQSLALSITLMEKFEIMKENQLFVQKSKQLLNQIIPALEQYIDKIISAEKPEEKEDIKKGAVVIQELYSRIETCLTVETILDVSLKKTILTNILEADTKLTKKQRVALFNDILDSGILTH